MADLASALSHLLKAKRITGPKQSYKTDNPAESQKVFDYLNGGARPSGVTSEMGMGLVEVEDVRRAEAPPPDPIPPDPVPPDPPPATWTGPIVITKGGTYNVSAEAKNAGDNAVSIQTSEPVVLTGRVRKLVAGDTAPIVRCPPGFGARLTMQNMTITGLARTTSQFGAGRAFQCEGYNSIVVQNCTLVYTGGIDVRNGLTGSTVLITRNAATNISGAYPRAQHPSDPQLHRQFCQMNGVVNATSLVVSWNQVINQVGESQIEDMISMYGGTKSALVENNYLQGGYPIFLNDKYSGDGIIVGDSGGNGNLVRNNQIVSQGHVGIGIEGGANNRVENNRIISSGRADSQDLRAAALGLYIPNAVAGANNTATGNLVRFMAHSPNSGDPIAAGTLNRGDQYTPGAANNVGSTNTFTPGGTVTTADEDAEWTFWQSKLSSNGIIVGA